MVHGMAPTIRMVYLLMFLVSNCDNISVDQAVTMSCSHLTHSILDTTGHQPVVNHITQETIPTPTIITTRLFVILLSVSFSTGNVSDYHDKWFLKLKSQLILNTRFIMMCVCKLQCTNSKLQN